MALLRPPRKPTLLLLLGSFLLLWEMKASNLGSLSTHRPASATSPSPCLQNKSYPLKKRESTVERFKWVQRETDKKEEGRPRRTRRRPAGRSWKEIVHSELLYPIVSARLD
jgi:hypothetical protein